MGRVPRPEIPGGALAQVPGPTALRPNKFGPSCPRPWRRLALGLEAVNFDATLRYPGEGPLILHSTPTHESKTLTLVTANGLRERTLGYGYGDGR